MEFVIDLSGCRIIAWDLESQLRLLRQYMVELDCVMADLKAIDDMAIHMIVLKLKKRRQELQEDIQKLRLMLTALDQIINQYKRIERKIEETSETCIARMKVEGNWPKKERLIIAIALPRQEIITKYFN